MKILRKFYFSYILLGTTVILFSTEYLIIKYADKKEISGAYKKYI